MNYQTNKSYLTPEQVTAVQEAIKAARTSFLDELHSLKEGTRKVLLVGDCIGSGHIATIEARGDTSNSLYAYMWFARFEGGVLSGYVKLQNMLPIQE